MIEWIPKETPPVICSGKLREGLICDHCGATYSTREPQQRYCRVECRQEVAKERNKASKAKMKRARKQAQIKEKE